MTTTLTLDEEGRLTLPEPLQRVFGLKPGMLLRAEVSEGRMEIVSDENAEPVTVTQLVETDGVLLLPKRGILVDAAGAIRAEREALADRAVCR
jgi:bifunctional DNA-binding transcriptional regulator/antitoxin component of YhaV-PrlF toxin-antitoxin module